MLVAALLVLSACGDAGGRAGDASGSGPAPGEYVATGLPSPYARGDVLRMTIHADEVAVQATCNTLSGTADWSAGTLEVSNLGGTEMGCPGQGFAQDDWLAEFLASSPRVGREGADVVLTGRGGAVLTLRPADQVAAPDAGADPGVALEHTTWRLTGVARTEGEAASLSTPPPGVRSTLRIARAEITLRTGCGVARGLVRVDGDRIIVGEVSRPETACPPSARGVADAVAEVLLGDPVRWSITGRTLTVGEGGLALVYEGV